MVGLLFTRGRIYVVEVVDDGRSSDVCISRAVVPTDTSMTIGPSNAFVPLFLPHNKAFSLGYTGNQLKHDRVACL